MNLRAHQLGQLRSVVERWRSRIAWEQLNRRTRAKQEHTDIETLLRIICGDDVIAAEVATHTV